MFVLTTVTRDCKNGDLYVSVDDNAYLTKEAASAALRARYEDFLKSMQTSRILGGLLFVLLRKEFL